MVPSSIAITDPTFKVQLCLSLAGLAIAALGYFARRLARASPPRVRVALVVEITPSAPLALPPDPLIATRHALRTLPPQQALWLAREVIERHDPPSDDSGHDPPSDDSP